MNDMKKEFLIIMTIGLLFIICLKVPSLQAIEFDLTAAQNAVGKRFASKFCEVKEKGFRDRVICESLLQ